MSSVINPAMQSVAQSFAPQQTTDRTNDEREEQAAKRSTAGDNSSVTISTQAQNLAAFADDLANFQRVNTQDAVENEVIEANHTNNGLTYAANLQAQALYNAQQLAQADTQMQED